jgi:CheY-like chemotaxis protein
MIMESSGIHVLMVDDNDDDVLMIREAMEEAKVIHLVQTVSDGEQALGYLRRLGPFQNAIRPDLILLDINMPKKSGFEVLQEMKTDRELCIIPVVMLTTSLRDEDIARSYAKGASSYLAKPTSFQDLQQLVNQFASYWTSVSRLPTAVARGT